MPSAGIQSLNDKIPAKRHAGMTKLLNSRY